MIAGFGLALAALPVVRITREATVTPGRILALPADQPTLTDLIAVTRDAGDLRRWLYDLRYTVITSSGPAGTVWTWTPDTSDRYLDFWRLFTRPAKPAENGVRLWGIVPGQPPRALSLDEPPGLLELATPGDRLYARREYHAALEAFARAHATAPSFALLFARMAACRLKLGDPRGAVADLARALARAGAGAELLDQLGDAFLAARQPGRAAAAWEQAAGLDDTSAARWVKAARGLDVAGYRPAARAAARRALDRDPANRQAREIFNHLRTP